MVIIGKLWPRGYCRLCNCARFVWHGPTTLGPTTLGPTALTSPPVSAQWLTPSEVDREGFRLWEWDQATFQLETCGGQENWKKEGDW